MVKDCGKSPYVSKITHSKAKTIWYRPILHSPHPLPQVCSGARLPPSIVANCANLLPAPPHLTLTMCPLAELAHAIFEKSSSRKSEHTKSWFVLIRNCFHQGFPQISVVFTIEIERILKVSCRNDVFLPKLPATGTMPRSLGVCLGNVGNPSRSQKLNEN